MKKLLWKFVKPFVKKQAIKYVENDANQEKIIDLLNQKVDLPNMTEEAEELLLNQVYDALQIAIVDMIEEI